MVQSSTWCARFVNNYLEARDQRQVALVEALGDGHRAVVFLSLNVPGAEKAPRGSGALFSWALREIQATCPPFVPLAVSQDALGHFAIVATGRAPVAVKRIAVALEASHPAGRLVDLDVYLASGEQIGRRELGYPARTCLLCDQPAVDCMRLKRHAHDEVVARTYELLANFNA